MKIEKLILASASDAALDFIYTDRKDDAELPRGEIEKAIEEGRVTIEAIVDTFENKLREYV